MNTRKGPSVYIRLKSKSMKLILKGLKIISEENKTRSVHGLNTFHSTTRGGLINNSKPHIYNKYKPLIIFLLCSYSFLYIKHNFLQFEYQKLKQPNFLIPKFIYRIRREHYVYWEKSRLARGLPTTFSYYNYDKESKMINITKQNGEVEVKKILFKPGSESKEVLETPILETIYKRRKFSEYKANKLLLYYMNIDNKYDLDNYLQYKSINIMDLFRALYYKFFLVTGIADVYRNEQYMPKPDILYDYDRLILLANLNSFNKKRVENDMYFLFLYFCVRFYNEAKDMLSF